MRVRMLPSLILGLMLCQALCVWYEKAEAMQPYASPESLRRYLEMHLGAAERLMAVDAGALIQEHAHGAMEAVNTAPWRDRLTPALVENYILPVRVTEEPLEPWRPMLRDAVTPAIRGIQEPLEAALAIRRWLSQRVVPGQSPPWSMGPLGLLRAGAGRCEELGILFVCAARSVGLPARICYTPAWRDMDGNHLWVEVWNGAGWSALSVEQPDAAPDTGWFFPHTDRAPVILARGFGHAPARLDAGDALVRNDRAGFVINRTAAYTTTGTLHARITDAHGAPARARIQIHVFNSGRPRVVLRTAETTNGTFLLGTGTYLISAATEQGLSFDTVTIRRDAVAEARLTPSPGKEGVLPQLPRGGINQRIGFTDPAHEHPATRPGPQQRPLPAARSEWEAHLASTDRIYARPTELRREENSARQAWKTLWRTQGTSPALRPMFAQYVLSGRIGKEPFSHWRSAMEKNLSGIVIPGDARSVALHVNEWAARLQMHSPQLASPLPLETVLRRNICGSERDRVSVAVAGLRALGVPARLVSLGEGFAGNWGPWAEFFDGTDWIPFYPAAPQYMGSHTATPAARQFYAPLMRIELKTVPSDKTARQGIEVSAQSNEKYPVTDWNAFRRAQQTSPLQVLLPSQNWLPCRITPQGAFIPASDVLIGPSSDPRHSIALEGPRGKYALVWGQRDSEGWATWGSENINQ